MFPSMKTSACIVCFIGIPASGKTFLCKMIDFYLSNHKSNSFVVTSISFDDEFDVNKLDFEDWKVKRRLIQRKIINILENNGPFDVSDPTAEVTKQILILDDNMYYRSMRYEYVKLAKRYKIGFIQFFMDASLEDALYHNNNRATRVPEDVIKQMYSRIEKPKPEKYSWEKNSFNLTSFKVLSKDDLEVIEELIIKSLNEPLEMEHECVSQPEVPLSKVHLADLALRLVVQKKMNNFSKNCSDRKEISNYGYSLAKEKQTLLKQIKMGLISLPDATQESDRQIIDTFLNYLFPYL